MIIKVLGTGCAGCKTLHENVKQAVAELGIIAEVTKVEDMGEIIRYNVMSTPALVIDGKVISAGKKLSVPQLKEILG